MTHQNQRIDLEGQKGPSIAMKWLYVPLIFFGGTRVVMHITERFHESTQDGFQAIFTVAAIFAGLTVFAFACAAILEILIVLRARDAAGTSDLIPMNLSVNSYRQAFDISGKPVFLPKKHQGVLVALRPDAIELFAGVRRYSGPTFRIPFAEVHEFSRETLQLYGGKEPGMVITTTDGPFELGFVRTVGARPFSISKKQAEARYALFQSALDEWRRRAHAQDT